jgi:hypothetical protein
MTHVKTNTGSAQQFLSSLNKYDELIIILSWPKYGKGQSVKATYEPENEDTFQQFNGFIESRYYDIDFGQWEYEICNKDYTIKVVKSEFCLDKLNNKEDKK